jgi:L-ascorbate metabolism protein UlaG (beta-lactamase superfamily)
VSAELTWLGQAGFRLGVEGLQVLIDPFLSEYEARLFPPPDPVPLATGVDFLLATHDHLDHLDTGFLPTLAEHSPGATVVLPTPHVGQVDALGCGLATIGVQPGDSLELSEHVRLDVLPAWHGFEVADGYTEGRGDDGLGHARFVGYVVRTPELSIYHSGDTIVTDELREALASAAVDVALLPINGRDYFREAVGLVGNMDAREAVKLSEEAGVRLLIPMHWDLFAGNTVRPGTAVDEAAEGSTLHVLTVARFTPMPLPAFPPRGASA